MVSFKVVFLFINVPFPANLYIIADFIYNSSNKKVPAVPIDIFIQLLKLTTWELFLYKDKLYEKIDEIAMSSLLGFTFAYLFVAHLKIRIKDLIYRFSRKRISDIFIMFLILLIKIIHVLNFLVLNSQRNNIRLTVEKAENILTSLDVEIKINCTDFDSWTWQKPMHIGLLLSFKAICFQH